MGIRQNPNRGHFDIKFVDQCYPIVYCWLELSFHKLKFFKLILISRGSSKYLESKNSFFKDEITLWQDFSINLFIFKLTMPLFITFSDSIISFNPDVVNILLHQLRYLILYHKLISSCKNSTIKLHHTVSDELLLIYPENFDSKYKLYFYVKIIVPYYAEFP